jgi:hypothetical protein
MPRKGGGIMPGKKAHKPRNTDLGAPGAKGLAAQSRKSTGQTEGHYTRDPKGRKGQYGAAGDAPLTKK